MAAGEMMKSCMRYTVLGGKCNPVLYGMEKVDEGRDKISVGNGGECLK
jgi:hypothetical protein